MPLHLSPQAQSALKLLGRLIKVGRTERKLSAGDLAARAGISRALLHRIEQGDPTCGIGAVFEAAAIAGVPLFDADGRAIHKMSLFAEHRLSLLPKAVRRVRQDVADDF